LCGLFGSDITKSARPRAGVAHVTWTFEADEGQASMASRIRPSWLIGTRTMSCLSNLSAHAAGPGAAPPNVSSQRCVIAGPLGCQPLAGQVLAISALADQGGRRQISARQCLPIGGGGPTKVASRGAGSPHCGSLLEAIAVARQLMACDVDKAVLDASWILVSAGIAAGTFLPLLGPPFFGAVVGVQKLPIQSHAVDISCAKAILFAFGPRTAAEDASGPVSDLALVHP